MHSTAAACAMVCAMAVGALALAGCNSLLDNRPLQGPGDGGIDAPADAAADACSGIGCMVANCASQGKPPTSVSGTVRTPDGVLPLYNALVYIPTRQLDPIVDGPANRACASGSPLRQTFTDASGHFKLSDVPSIPNLPLVIQVGKWRREIAISGVTDCGELMLSSEQTRLPKSSLEGHLPHIAVTTGAADALECIMRRVGVSDSEHSSSSGSGRIHLYVGEQSTTTMVGSEVLDPVDLLYDRMSQYDMLLLSCDGHPIMRSQLTAQKLRDYIDSRGWAWLAHYNSAWLAQPTFPTIANFNTSEMTPIPPKVTARIDTTTAKGQVLANWMTQFAAPELPGQVSLETANNTCTDVQTVAQRLVYFDPPLSQGLDGVQLLTWAPGSGGQLYFTDFHFQEPTPFMMTFPGECESAPLTPEGMLTVFQLFDQPTCLP